MDIIAMLINPTLGVWVELRITLPVQVELDAIVELINYVLLLAHSIVRLDRALHNHFAKIELVFLELRDISAIQMEMDFINV